jgi:hypothetical protein
MKLHWSKVFADFLFSPVNIIPALLHIRLPLSLEMCDSPDQAAHIQFLSLGLDP